MGTQASLRDTGKGRLNPAGTLAPLKPIHAVPKFYGGDFYFVSLQKTRRPFSFKKS
jgi:hypothetical protein